MHSDVIGVGINGESNGFNSSSAQPQSLADAVHPIHDTAVSGEDDGVTQVGRLHQTGVLHDGPTGWIVAVPEPERLVEFSEGFQRNVDARSVLGQRDQPVNIPRHRSPFGGAKVVLLSHGQRTWCKSPDIDMDNRLYTFIGGEQGRWEAVALYPVKGPALERPTRLDVHPLTCATCPLARVGHCAA